MQKYNNYFEYIFYVHKGNSDYLLESLKQVKVKSPNSKIILLGDEIDNSICEGIQYENINKYNGYANEFEKYYIHLSDKEYNYEIFCIQRWFIILEYMVKNNIQAGFYQDSDCILDCDIEHIVYDNKFWYCDCSGHTSAFTVDILNDFCDFILSYYKKKEKLMELCEIRSHMKHIKETNKWTNVTDMELLSLYIYYNESRVSNIGERTNGGIFGFNVNAQDHTNAFHMHKYDFIGDKTKIYLINGKLYAKDSIINKFERLFSIHFHSDNKCYIKSFVKYNEIDSVDGIYCFNFNLSQWEKEDCKKEMDIIDYKVSKEALMNLKKNNSKNVDAYDAIREYAKLNDISANIIDNNIKKVSNGNYKQLNIKSRKIIGWGCGNGINHLKQYYDIKFDYFVDVDEKKVGHAFNEAEIFNISNILSEDKNNIFIIVLSISYYQEIRGFLKFIGLQEERDFISMESLIGYIDSIN
ncbi:hypothetical protein [Inconstantimicrobium mannanitabidum]|uniref:Uncharacterized protein n=1 Tax=Inconstantimicrobium mannanitabidum TaxID=1604901 RepID=A0ACB5R8J8_9CLOT|nr:hypothetical protein [Clostridium sp. TW13]GKX65513.1 hypothetical protein rsdtw13_07710 [Clostridium sp. TW13]